MPPEAADADNVQKENLGVDDHSRAAGKAGTEKAKGKKEQMVRPCLCS